MRNLIVKYGPTDLYLVLELSSVRENIQTHSYRVNQQDLEQGVGPETEGLSGPETGED